MDVRVGKGPWRIRSDGAGIASIEVWSALGDAWMYHLLERTDALAAFKAGAEWAYAIHPTGGNMTDVDIAQAYYDLMVL